MNDNKKPLSGAEKLELLRNTSEKFEQLNRLKRKLEHLDFSKKLGLDIKERLRFDVKKRLSFHNACSQMGIHKNLYDLNFYNNSLLVFYKSINGYKGEQLSGIARIHRAARKYEIAKKKLEKSIFHKKPVNKSKKWKRKYKELKKQIEADGQEVEKIHSFIIDNEKINNKGKSKPTEKKATLNPQFDTEEENIKTICEKMKGLIKADLSAWINLFSDDMRIFEKPMNLNCSNRVLGYFLVKLKDEGFIYNGKHGKILEDLKAFKSADGNILNQSEINSAKKGVLKMGRNTKDERNLIDDLIVSIGGGA